MNDLLLRDLQSRAENAELVGIFADIPIETYHSFGRYISSSGLCEFKRSPAHYRAYLRKAFEPSDAQLIGTAVHQRLLEPEVFAQNHILGPEVEDRRSKVWKDFVAANPDRQVWRAKDWERINRTADNIANHPRVKPLLVGAKIEQSIFWIDAETGVPCRCRPDILFADGLCPDIKTTKDASPESFQYAIRDYSYHMRLAFYIDGIAAVLGLKQDTGILIAAEKEDPYAVVPYVLEPDAKYRVDPIEQGRKEYRELLKRYAECERTNSWPSYTTDFVGISLPSGENYRITEEEFAS
jgi:hypothetical protein